VENIGIHSLLALSGDPHNHDADVKKLIAFNHHIIGTKSADNPGGNAPVTISGEITPSLQAHIDKDYASLSKALHGQNGYPWTEIMGFQSPETIEQLTRLYQLISTKFPSSHIPSGNALMDFCLEICRQNPETKQNRLPNLSQPLLGKIIFLVNRDPLLAANKINLKLKQESLIWIEAQFKAHIQDLLHSLKTRYDDHKKTHLQSPELALRVYRGIEIADFLITDIGTINAGIIPDLLEILTQNQLQSYGYEIKIRNVLDVLMQSPKLRDKFSEITKPKSKFAPANDILRIMLGKTGQSPVTDVDAKKAALGAMLSYLRQGPTGSCFATYIAIEMHSTRFEKTLEDFASLIKWGKLTRKVDGVSMDFPFIMSMGHSDLGAQISIHRNGALSMMRGSPSFLWEAPGLVAACRAMGLDDPEKALMAVVLKLFSVESDTMEFKKVTVNDLLKMLALYETELNSGKQKATSYQKGVFAYESQTNNALLKVWENAIAGMAEGKERSLIKTLILDAISRTIDKIIQETYPVKAGIISSFVNLLENKLVSTIQLQYDPAVHQDIPANDKHSTDAGFILYDKSNSLNINEWKRIDTPAAFQSFLDNKIKEVIKDLREKETNNVQRIFLKQIQTILTEHINSNEFVEALLKQYHPQNAQLEHPLQQLPSLKYTPWTTKTGNDSKNVYNVYMETSLISPTVRFAPANAKALLAKIIDIAKTKVTKESNNERLPANFLIPARIPALHTFLLMPGHPSFIKALNDSGTAEKWIDENVINIGREISETYIDMKTRMILITHAYQNLLPRDKILDFIAKITKAPELISIKNFRNFILETIKAIAPEENYMEVERTRQLDTLLCQNIPETLRKKIESSAVHFADTNWAEGIHDIHFCFAVNPGSGDLEIWEVYDNGSSLSALDQKKWLVDKEWEIFTEPFPL